MTAKEYLKQAYWLDQKINSDLAELARLKEIAASIGSPALGERNNPNRQTEAPFVRGLERVWEMEKRIDAEIDRLVDLKEQIRGIIDRLDNPDEQMLLRYRYLHHDTWENIASMMNYSVRWVYKLHAKALISFAAAMEGGSHELS